MNQFFLHTSEEMPELEDGSVALTVTSPPYWNAIDYDIHASDHTRFYRTRAYDDGYLDYPGYLDWLGKIFSEVFRVTKPGGFCAIVIGTVLLDGKHYPVPFDAIRQLVDRGWEFHQDVVWHKCTAGVKRAGVTIRQPYPGYYYPNIMTEYILVFRKPGLKIYKGRSEVEKTTAGFPIDQVFKMDVANNIWHIAPVPPGMMEHPAPYPEEIPYRLISLYSYPGEIILDPFLGSGQTSKVAKWLNRQYAGYEIIPKYIELAEKRLDEPLMLRREQLVVKFEKAALGKIILD
jgi:site-specific DNA-methyltransferase (adenine-specific)